MRKIGQQNGLSLASIYQEVSKSAFSQLVMNKMYTHMTSLEKGFYLRPNLKFYITYIASLYTMYLAFFFPSDCSD